MATGTHYEGILCVCGLGTVHGLTVLPRGGTNLEEEERSSPLCFLFRLRSCRISLMLALIGILCLTILLTLVVGATAAVVFGGGEK